MGDRNDGDDGDTYVDLTAEEAVDEHPSDALAVEAHSLLSAVSIAQQSIEAMDALDLQADAIHLQDVVRRQLAFIDSRLREVARGLPAGSLTDSSRDDPT